MHSETSSSVFHIGLDDTDSSDGMCTTFLTFNLVKILLRHKGTRLLDYPNLIRLNPNIPWKTRGNAALVIRLETTMMEEKDIFKICYRQLRKFATSKRANSGLVVFKGEKIPQSVVEFSRRALFEVQSLSRAKEILEKEEGFRYVGLRNKQGLVGALAGIGNELKDDYTFELIAYRKSCKKKRIIDKRKVVAMDRKTRFETFNCYDEVNDRILIAPHGPDPVLLGIRGETPLAVKNAFRMLLPIKNLSGYIVFRSNQGTGEHLKEFLDLSHVKAYTSGRVKGVVSSKPSMAQGGHTYFELKNDQGGIPCAAYEPTGRFRLKVLSLVVGDLIEVGGGIRKGTSTHPKILNLEYMIPRKLVSLLLESNPKCPRCFGPMDSEGKEKGYECRHCGYRSNMLSKSSTLKERELTENRLYLPDLKAHRHLTKPLQRFLLKKIKDKRIGAEENYLVEDWISA